MDDYTNDIIFTYEKNNKEEVRKLWEDSFNDPDSFVDYYFENIYEKNRVLSAVFKGELIGMIHLNPYKVNYMGEEYDCSYIVGVAVRSDMQGKGVMKSMMKKVLDDIKDEAPFAFLMPKKQEYYNSLGFLPVYSTRLLDISIVDVDEFDRDVMDNYSSLMLDVVNLSQLESNEYCEIAEWMNHIMSNQYNGFCRRDGDYMNEFLQEHLCQHGDVCIVTESEVGDDGEEIYHNLVGVFAYDIYDEVMYVERFWPTQGNMVALLSCVMKQAVDITCDRLIVTVADDDLEDVSHLVSGAELDISNGNGVMVIGLLENTEQIVTNLQSNCFFDEIV